MGEYLITFAAPYVTALVLIHLTDVLDAVIEHLRGKNGN